MTEFTFNKISAADWRAAKHLASKMEDFGLQTRVSKKDQREAYYFTLSKKQRKRDRRYSDAIRNGPCYDDIESMDLYES